MSFSYPFGGGLGGGWGGGYPGLGMGGMGGFGGGGFGGGGLGGMGLGGMGGGGLADWTGLGGLIPGDVFSTATGVDPFFDIALGSVPLDWGVGGGCNVCGTGDTGRVRRRGRGQQGQEQQMLEQGQGQELPSKEPNTKRMPIRSHFTPTIDVFETQNEYLISVDFPGVKKEDIQVKLNDKNQLTIIGERKPPENVEQRDLESRRGRAPFGKFSRVLQLPENTELKEGNIKAKHENGVLTINVPKKKEEKGKAEPGEPAKESQAKPVPIS
jgi:HSP20 family protein